MLGATIPSPEDVPQESQDRTPVEVPGWSRMLLVEDDTRMRQFLAEVFRAEGYSVDAVGDGNSAISTLFDEPDALAAYDIIVSDVRVPGMDGVEIASHVTQNCGPPVVLMSAFATPDLVRRGTAAGALDVIAKPFNLESLVTLIRRVAPPEM